MISLVPSTILFILSSISFSTATVSNGSLVCSCDLDGCPPHSDKDYCIAPVNGKCYRSMKEDRDPVSKEIFVIHSAGCFDETAWLQCKSSLLNTREHMESSTYLRVVTACCGDSDRCNDHLYLEFPEVPTTTTKPITVQDITLAVSVSLVTALIIVLIITYGFCKMRKRRLRSELQKQRLENLTLLADPFSFAKKETEVEKVKPSEIEATSGSGSGVPQLIQTTIAKQLQFLRIVGKGRYGEVWHAQYRGADVAVKIFLTLEEASWEAERDLYGTHMLRDDNILGFIAADIGGTGACTQMLLITQFHPSSLYDYLRKLEEPLPVKTLLTMAEGIANGLSHLHAEIVGTAAKPSIVHRDLKSKNILVKADGVSCVIGDFGLALREDKFKDFPADKDFRQGTKRYMAPEILDGTVRRCFDSLRMADMYAFGLVLWELIQCTGKEDDYVNQYELPYHSAVGSDPGFDEMRKWVAEWKMRPAIEKEWLREPVLREFVKLMEECWHTNPAARLTALRTKKTISRMLLEAV